MANYPTYLPFNSGTNYTAVLNTSKEMYGDIVNQYGCCPSKGINEVLNEVDIYLAAVEIDANDPARFTLEVQSIYLLMYNIV